MVGSATKLGAISIVMKPELSATADTNSTELPSSAADLTESSPAYQAAWMWTNAPQLADLLAIWLQLTAPTFQELISADVKPDLSRIWTAVRQQISDWLMEVFPILQSSFPALKKDFLRRMFV